MITSAGCKQVVRQLPLDPSQAHKILEVGCGTGYNLRLLTKRFPKAQLTGLDVSEHMVNKAARTTQAYPQRVSLEERSYTLGDTRRHEQMNAVLFSYSLTMINPQWAGLLQQAHADLKPGGYIAVVDFYDSRFPWFKQHMDNNHVRMDSHLSPVLEETFDTVQHQLKPAYGGVWHYFLYIGQKV